VARLLWFCSHNIIHSFNQQKSSAPLQQHSDMPQNLLPFFVIQLLMGVFKNALFWARLSVPPPPRPNTFEFFSLRSLPTEIVPHNSRFLTLESVVSLSLCCRPVYFALGTQYVEDLRSKEESTAFNYQRFIIKLERDLPDQITCHYYKKFYKIRKSDRRLHSNSDYFSHLKCWKMDYEQWPVSIFTGSRRRSLRWR
jgi:hypothetical protein